MFQHLPDWIGSFLADLSEPGQTFTERFAVHDGKMLLTASGQPAGGMAVADLSRCAISHCGLVRVTEGQVEVLDALDQTRWVPFDEWKARGWKGQYLQMRCAAATPADITRVLQQAEKFVGVRSDLTLARDDQRVDGAELIEKSFLRGAQLQLANRPLLADLAWKRCELAIRAVQNGDLRLNQAVMTPMTLVRGGKLTLIYSSLAPLTFRPPVPSELPHRIFSGVWKGQFQFDDGNLAAAYVEFDREGEFVRGWLLMPSGERRPLARFGLIPLDATGEFLAEIWDARGAQIQVQGTIRDDGQRLWGSFKNERGPRGLVSLAKTVASE